MEALLGELLADLLGTVSIAVHPRPDWVADIDETGDTLTANARQKAHAIAEATGAAALSDDTGLMVDALGGAPGVRSARFAGPDATDSDNRRLLLERLRGVADADRTAAFSTVVVLRLPDGTEHLGEGRVAGRIGREEVGDGGFGYDSLFIPAEGVPTDGVPSGSSPTDGDGRTFAQMSAAEKNAISHRARALADLLRQPEVERIFASARTPTP